ncbi:TMEM165/GDT1 family protein [Anaerobranca gottschalkii]|uniref:GDT1 family protein n=1 Tax=Anaerobranca gottschalkii DSM 13577 TaxID=1120990 RepID=A0A1H9ZZ59_9FIRM|nr:TMEM165/GDT1 family protein [Anaerobranca gottschalkii]SES87068.1 Putative Ca2+/H+ antiporter, TMEM165/GDT1 family [Anaerobranca gottschalkii DSM 13577]
MISEILSSLIFIFLAEMGDKTQLLALAFATKYKLSAVLTGVFLGSLLNHSLAVIIGLYLSSFIPLNIINIATSFAFIIFGLWTLKIDEGEEECLEEGKCPPKFHPILIVASAFFLGEIGDKTQLTVITLSTSARYPLGVLLGTVTGMVITSSIGVFIGNKLGKKIPENIIKLISGLIFILFGLINLYEFLPSKYLTLPNILFSLSIIILIIYPSIKRIFPFQKQKH